MGGSSRQGVLFEGLVDKPIQIEFTQPSQSSDGGVVLLQAVDEEIGLTASLASVLRDKRQAVKVKHSLAEILKARIFAIACGYPDCNDLDLLGGDPMLKLVCKKSPTDESRLASQPTASRFENAVSRTELLRLAYQLTDVVLEAQQRRRRNKRPHRITIDLDPTEDPTYGGQQLTFFNAFYDNWCYLPMAATLQFDNESDEFAVAPLLRPGNAGGSVGAIAILDRLVPRVRAAFPGVKVRVRMDGAFSTPEVLEWLEKHGLEYFINVPKNSVLIEKAERFLKRVRAEAKRSGQTERTFGEVRYKAGKWKKPRRVIVKAEVTVCEGRDNRDNPRFVVTNSEKSPERVYSLYAIRGDMENRIKELHYDLRFDLTSCTSFKANQCREILTVAAYVLYQHLRYHARQTQFARAQVGTLRNRLIKIGTTVLESVRRIVLKAPKAFAAVEDWIRIATSIGATNTG